VFFVLASQIEEARRAFLVDHGATGRLVPAMQLPCLRFLAGVHTGAPGAGCMCTPNVADPVHPRQSERFTVRGLLRMARRAADIDLGRGHSE
jgi:hypothetical protein